MPALQFRSRRKGGGGKAIKKKKCTPPTGLTTFPGWTGWDRPERVPRPGRRRRRHEHPRRRDSSPAHLCYHRVTPSPREDAGCALDLRREAGDRGRRGATLTPEPARRRGQLQGSPAPSRGQRRRGPRAGEAGKGAPVPAPPPDRGKGSPYLCLDAGSGCGAAREGPERGPPARPEPARPPGARRGEERGAKGEGRGGRPRS